MKKITFVSLILLTSTACSAESLPTKSVVINCQPGAVTVETAARAEALIFNGKKIDSGKLKEKCEIAEGLSVSVDIDLSRKDDYKEMPAKGDSKYRKLVSAKSEISFDSKTENLSRVLIPSSIAHKLSYTSQSLQSCINQVCETHSVNDLEKSPFVPNVGILSHRDTL